MIDIVLGADQLCCITRFLLSSLSILSPTMHSVSQLCIPGLLQSLSFQSCSAPWQAVNVSRLEVCFWCLYLSVTCGAGLCVCECVFNQKEAGLRKAILWQLPSPHLLHAITELLIFWSGHGIFAIFLCNYTPHKRFVFYCPSVHWPNFVIFSAKFQNFYDVFNCFGKWLITNQNYLQRWKTIFYTLCVGFILQ